MTDTEFISLDEFKEIKKISDSNGNKIALYYNRLIDEYFSYSENQLTVPMFSEQNIRGLLEECRQINPTLIPYSEITNIIFTSDDALTVESETSFIERFKSAFEKYIIKRFAINTSDGDNFLLVSLKEYLENYREKEIDNEELFDSPSEKSKIRLRIEEDYQNAILVVYKIIQHSELAISQKRSLYENLKDDMNYLDLRVDEATERYDNMMSNFISILGIFAAIMMATFGAIQGFTAIYSNENNYSLAKILIISSFGLFALVSILYLLLYSISKIIGKDIAVNDYGYNFFMKFPIYSHTLVITSLIFLFSLTHMFKYNPPSYFPDHLSDNLWGYTILILVILLISYYVYSLFSRNNGSFLIDNQINRFLRNITEKIGVNRLVNIVTFFISLILVTIIVILLLIILN